MEANSQIPVGENSLPEAIQDKNGLVIGTLKTEEMAHAFKHFAEKMNKAAVTIKNTAETANRVFP